MPAIFPVKVLIEGYGHAVDYEVIENDYGGGYVTTMTRGEAFSHANGKGGLANYKGLNRFRFTAIVKYGTTSDSIRDFIRARLDANNESFYFYNQEENPDINLATADGSDTVGRYLVKFVTGHSDYDSLARDVFSTGVEVREVRA